MIRYHPQAPVHSTHPCHTRHTRSFALAWNCLRSVFWSDNRSKLRNFGLNPRIAPPHRKTRGPRPVLYGTRVSGEPGRGEAGWVDGSGVAKKRHLMYYRYKRCLSRPAFPALSSEKQDSNPRPSAWEADALPTELFFAIRSTKSYSRFFRIRKILRPKKCGLPTIFFSDARLRGLFKVFPSDE